ncbi:lamin tail domain-containing protein [Lentzea sp. HUAS12]|uniref:lamin tail domain-containing protein n=1 Tax=Lentzea sp. HUAS12 TaxID=2951806 RepID=UPI00209FE572|nr:lamin tail domain-containing protein [Lentzea sp. HUAS12]USX52582.1 lamin tail domain-containing protein [Lentzea sp. HUAS12]
MRRLLSGATALAIAGTIALTGLASAAEEPEAPEVMQLPVVLINEVSAMGPNGPLDEAIEIINTSSQQLDLNNWVIRIYNQRNEVIQTIPLVDVTGESVVLAPNGNVGSTLVLTGAEFSGTVTSPNVQPVRFLGEEGIPVHGGVAVFGSAAPNAFKVDGVAFSSAVSAAKEGVHAQPENQRTAQLNGSNTRNLLNQDTNNNQRDFSLQERTF